MGIKPVPVYNGMHVRAVKTVGLLWVLSQAVD